MAFVTPVGTRNSSMGPPRGINPRPIYHRATSGSWRNEIKTSSCYMFQNIFYHLEGREREMFYLMTHSTHLRLYDVRHMVKDHCDSEKGNPMPPHRLLLLINSKGSFICTIPQTG